MPSHRRHSMLLFLLAMFACAAPAAAADFMFQGTIDGEEFEGRPLAWTDDVMHLLARDGRHLRFDPHEVKNAKKTAKDFAGYSFPEMRRELQREFGDKMEITTTKHYLVVHPRGTSAKWADHFEELYRAFLAYFRVRGFTAEEPKFPLVAIVYKNQAEFDQKVSSQDVSTKGYLGFYFHDSNRVETYDLTADHPNADWSKNADTMIHEATHQTAFNVGIHNRFAIQPQWLVEGLATMFEARGVWNSAAFHSMHDRINEGRFADFRANLKKRQPGTFGNLIASDRMFKTDASAAYAEAWAMMLFLCETRPHEMADYLHKVAARADFSDYYATQRVNDFAECFGSDFKILEANFLSWMSQLK